MNTQIKGKIIQIQETQTFPSGFTKREFVVDTGGEYPQQIPMSFNKDKCGVLDGYQEGQHVEVEVNIRGNEHNGRYYVNLQAWKMKLDEQHQGEDTPDF